MKTLIVSLRHALCISLFSFLGSQLYSQGNLQFNQVKNTAVSSSYALSGGINSITSANFTVPVGKVWKVEGIYLNTVNASNSVNYITSSGSSIIETSLTSNLMGSNTSTNVLWLPAGTYAVKTYLNCGGIGNCTGDVFNTVNAIEFNIIP